MMWNVEVFVKCKLLHREAHTNIDTLARNKCQTTHAKRAECKGRKNIK